MIIDVRKLNAQKLYRGSMEFTYSAPEDLIAIPYVKFSAPVQIKFDYELYEDDGETFDYQEGKSCVTTFCLEEDGEKLRLTVTPPADSHGLLPEKRQIWLKFRDVAAEEICVTVGSQPVVVGLTDVVPLTNEPREELRSAILTRVQADNQWKSSHFKRKLPQFVADALAELDTMEY